MERKVWDGRFKGKVAIVTGGLQVSATIMEELCREGAAVCFSDMSDSGKDLSNHGSQGYDVLFCQGTCKAKNFKGIVDKTLQRCTGWTILSTTLFVHRQGSHATADWERSFCRPGGIRAHGTVLRARDDPPGRR